MIEIVLVLVITQVEILELVVVMIMILLAVVLAVVVVEVDIYLVQILACLKYIIWYLWAILAKLFNILSNILYCQNYCLLGEISVIPFILAASLELMSEYILALTIAVEVPIKRTCIGDSI